MIRASSIAFWFGLIILASIGLYRTSDRVQELDRQLRAVSTQIEKERESLHVLKAEWTYLASPSRLATLSKRHLALRPTTTAQISTLGDLANALPTRNEAMANVAVNDTPMPTIRTSMASTPKTIVVAAKPANAAVVASSHLRDHMIIQRTASVAPLPGDSIGNLIQHLNTER